MGTFGKIFEYKEGSFTGVNEDDKGKVEKIYKEVFAKIKDTSDLTGVYKALFAYIIENADGSLKAYIENPDLQYLEEDNGTESRSGSGSPMSVDTESRSGSGSPSPRRTTDGTSITYKLSRGGETEFKERIKDEKKRVYNKWSEEKYSGNGDENSIKKAIDEFKKQIKVTWNANVGVSDYIKQVSNQASYDVTKKDDKAKHILNWLFDTDYEGLKKPDVKERFEIVCLFVDHCRIMCAKNCTEEDNQKRAENIITFIKKKFKISDDDTDIKQLENYSKIPGDRNFYNTLKKFLVEKLNQNEENKNTIYDLLKEPYITFSGKGDKVIKPALQEYNKRVKLRYGIADLDRAKKLKFNKEKVVDALLVALLREAQKIVQYLQLTFNEEFKGKITDYSDLENVQLFVLEQVDTLQKQSVRVGIEKNNKIDTGDVDSTAQVNNETGLNRPLVKIDEQTINFVNEHKDVFFILDRDNPNMAYNIKEHEIDFKKRKIFDGNNEVNNGTFWEALRDTISRSISGRLDWQALYKIDSNKTNNNVTTHLIWKTSGGGGHGIGRADDVNDDQYLWEYCGPSEYSMLGEIIELEKERQIINDEVCNKNLKKYDAPITLEANFDYKNGGEETNKKVRYSMVGILEKQGDGGNAVEVETETYVQVNTPYKLFSETKEGEKTEFARTQYGANRRDENNTDSARNNEIENNEIEQILNIFQFKYYRLIDDNNKVKKEVIYAKNRPKKEDVQTDANDTSIPLNPPICFQSGENYQNFRAFKKNRGVIKNKGKNLFKSTGPRQDAGTTMKDIRNNVNDSLQSNLPTSRLPATKLARAIVEKKNSMAVQDWQNLKGTEASELPTDQEWCHLLGHGDGGPEKLGNFVSGSFHCNTEQLAIEMGQRITTHAGKEGNYTLRSTAYLLKDDSMESSKYDDYKAMYGKLNENGTKNSSKDGDTGIKKTGAPVASFIRYKVYKNENGKETKILDYTFEGQSEFFDKNQYKILNYTVRFLLAGMDGDGGFEKWYDEKKEKLDDNGEESKRRKRARSERSESRDQSRSQSPVTPEPKKRKEDEEEEGSSNG